MSDLKHIIRDIPDFPEKGVIFRDITPLLNNPDAFEEVIDRLTEETEGLAIDRIVGVESRGFIFGTPLAMRLGVGFVPARKPGKLPAEIVREEYSLEYGTAAIEIHKDAITPGENVLILDDLLATGGTAAAACSLVEKLGGKITGCAFVIELDFLNGREKLPGRNIMSLIRY
jgi:adenine phosphoribosyltransferase